MGKYFIDPKSSAILSIFQVFPCTTQIALFWPKLLPALFLKKQILSNINTYHMYWHADSCAGSTSHAHMTLLLLPPR
jgi:hypothetical protein